MKAKNEDPNRISKVMQKAVQTNEPFIGGIWVLSGATYSPLFLTPKSIISFEI